MPAAAPARRAMVVRAGAVAVAVGAMVVTLGPIGWRPEVTGDAMLDRLVGGLVAGVAVASAWPGRWGAVAALLAVIVGLEAAQRLMPGRHGEAADAAVKLAGAVAGVAVVRLAGRGGNGSPARGVAAGTVAAAGLAALAWWLLAPPAAVRREIATRAWPAAAYACHAPGPPPTIDIWARTTATFMVTLRHGPIRTGCVLAFRRDGLAWRLTGVSVAPPR